MNKVLIHCCSIFKGFDVQRDVCRRQEHLHQTAVAATAAAQPQQDFVRRGRSFRLSAIAADTVIILIILALTCITYPVIFLVKLKVEIRIKFDGMFFFFFPLTEQGIEQQRNLVDDRRHQRDVHGTDGSDQTGAGGQSDQIDRPQSLRRNGRSQDPRPAGQRHRHHPGERVRRTAVAGRTAAEQHQPAVRLPAEMAAAVARIERTGVAGGRRCGLPVRPSGIAGRPTRR